MSYIRAEEVLPSEILATVQQYVDGQAIYIPRRPGSKKTWGAATETRKNLALRNLQMYTKYQNGACVTDLAQEYFLTEKSIRRILNGLSKNPPNEIRNEPYLKEE